MPGKTAGVAAALVTGPELLKQASLYYHTLRHLRPVQFHARLRSRLYRPQASVVRPLPAACAHAGRWMAPPRRPASQWGPASFTFLNETRALTSPADWNRPDWDKLWLYNAHYFDDLNAVGSEERRTWHALLMARWVAENPVGHGNGWEPYPTSLRIVNWVKWALAGNPLESAWEHSLAVQARWLRRHIEWHLLGNHLFANAKALVFAGLFFEGEDAGAWLARGLRILRRQVAEQILRDGGHFELSPMYHAIILGDLLDLVNAAGAWPGRLPADTVAQWRDTAARMLHWLGAMVHPDGGIAFFNDAAFGIAPEHAQLLSYAERLGIAPFAGTGPTPVTHFRHSGYLRLERHPAVALLDVAPVGPDYLPGHAHADTLSFELSLFGQRVVVNTGTSCYGSGPERQRQRGTAAHSTVEVGGADSSEVWESFRVARRARPFGLQVRHLGAAVEVACAHDGYRRLRGRPVHRRQWRLTDDYLRVNDTVEGRIRGEALARYHLHPAVAASGDGPQGMLRLADGRLVRWCVWKGTARVVASTWHPEFGRSVPCQCIEVRFDGPHASIEFSWR